MAQDPNNLVLMQLGEIRATLADHTARFDRLEKSFNEMRSFVNHALLLGTTAELRTRELDGRQDQSDAQHKGMDERLSNVERRVAQIEERLDPRHS